MYPYEYIDSFAYLQETHLPPKDAFFSKLIIAGISDEDNAHAQLVWRLFNMTRMCDYHYLDIASMPFTPFILSSVCMHLSMYMIVHIDNGSTPCHV